MPLARSAACSAILIRCERLRESSLQLLEPAALGAQLQQGLLGRGCHLQGGGHPVRIELRKRVRLGARLGDLLDQVGVARAGALEGLRPPLASSVSGSTSPAG